MTTVITHKPLRDDAPDAAEPTSPAAVTQQSRLWAVSGVAAAVAGVAAMITTTIGMYPVYDHTISGDADKVLAAMADLRGISTLFHVLTAATAMLLVPFAAGLFRRLRTTVPVDSLLPSVAAIGLAVTSVVLVMGSGLDTEFGFGLPDRASVIAENVAFYNHWVGTIPYLWTGAGLAGVALFVAARRHDAVPRWIGRVGLVLGGLTLIAGVSPLEYMAGLVGPIWLLVTTIGLLVGDRAHRR